MAGPHMREIEGPHTKTLTADARVEADATGCIHPTAAAGAATSHSHQSVVPAKGHLGVQSNEPLDTVRSI